MRSLTEILNEKLHINKDTKLSGKISNTIKFDFPLINNDYDCEVTDDVWKTLEIPFKKYVIFKDAYRRNAMHFSVLGDFLESLAFFQDDYEDFDILEDIILFASDSLEETFKYYMEKLNLTKVYSLLTGDEEYDYERISDLIYKSKNNNYHDSEDFITRVIIGEYDSEFIDKNCGDSIKEKDFNNFKEWLKRNIR